MKKLLLFAFCLIGSVCFAASNVFVISLGTIPYSAKIMIMYHGDEPLDSWTVRNTKTYLARSLEWSGYKLTKDINEATHIMYISYRKSESFDVTETKRRVLDKAEVVGKNANAYSYSYDYYDETSEQKIFTIDILAYSLQNGVLNKNTEYEIEMAQRLTSGQTMETALPFLFAAAINQKLFCKPSGGVLEWDPVPVFGVASEKQIIKRVRGFLKNPY